VTGHAAGWGRPVRVLMAGSIPPEWGGRTGGGVATMHRVLIEEFASGRYGIGIAAVLPFNLDPDRPGASAPVPAPVVALAAGGSATTAPLVMAAATGSRSTTACRGR
jgi:hypothetical protein